MGWAVRTVTVGVGACAEAAQGGERPRDDGGGRRREGHDAHPARAQAGDGGDLLAGGVEGAHPVGGIARIGCDEVDRVAMSVEAQQEGVVDDPLTACVRRRDGIAVEEHGHEFEPRIPFC